MKITLKLALIVALTTFLCPACGTGDPEPDSGTNPPVKSMQTAKAPETLDAAMALAKKEGKNLLVEYTARKCPFCKQMNGQVLNRDDVRAALEGVVWFRAVQEENADEFRDKWGAQGTPAFVVADAEGETLHGPVTGVIPAANFIAYVNWAKTGEGAVPALNPGSS
jgi:thioredoxin-related protein